jgi:cytochrome c peroxidase
MGATGALNGPGLRSVKQGGRHWQTPDHRYRTAPLRALWGTKQIHKSGFYHDGHLATLKDVVDHYNNHFSLDPTEQAKGDLIEYLKSL